MTLSAEVIDMLIKAKDCLRNSWRSYEDRNNVSVGNWESGAAYNIAMAAEYTMKAALYGEEISPAKIHDHVMLVAVCGYYGIKIPKEFRRYMSEMKDYESSSRYYNDFVLDVDEYLVIYKAVEGYVNVVWNSWFPVIKEEYAKILPPSLVNDDMSLRYINDSRNNLRTVKFRDCVSVSELRNRSRY